MTILKTHRYVTAWLFFILSTVLSAAPSFAKMRATQMVPANDVISYYKKEMAKGKLSADEIEIMNLAILANDVFEVKDFAASGYNDTKVGQVKAVPIYNIADAIEQAIRQRENWNVPLPKAKMNALKKEATLLKKALREQSLGWAWYLYQLGNKNEAQGILVSEFERAYDNTMKLTEISGFKRSPPTWEAETIHKVLIPLSSDPENKSREEKVQKMRLHISTLPNMQMMT